MGRHRLDEATNSATSEPQHDMAEQTGIGMDAETVQHTEESPRVADPRVDQRLPNVVSEDESDSVN